MSSSAASLPYHEPEIVTILVLSSFLLAENAINFAFDRVLFCGLIGQIAVGVAWGTPGANWLSEDVQNAIMQLGYLGLISLVYEGGLSTDLKTLRSNLFLSSVVALIGISAPIGLSFTLQGFLDITPVQAFAAGAALCSTSLGTTFTILTTSGLSQSRLGVVLSSAAMMDDVVGLVMSAVISSLGASSSDFSAITVIRPVFVSLAFAVLLPLICLWAVKPLTRLGMSFLHDRKDTSVYRLLTTRYAAFAFQTLVLLALVTAASYAGTSNLFAAYLAGVCIVWWDDLRENISAKAAEPTTDLEVPTTQRITAGQTNEETAEGVSSSPERETPTKNDSGQASAIEQPANSQTPSTAKASPFTEAEPNKELRGPQIFETFYGPTLQAILKPFFFASIGFSIPISQMFTGSVVWKGIVYFMLMTIGKWLCGICLVRFNGPVIPYRTMKRLLPSNYSSCWPWSLKHKAPEGEQTGNATGSQAPTSSETAATTDSERRKLPRVPKPQSLYPAALLGSAMVARGEIGFLISSVAETNGVLGASSNGESSELFLVVTWAILLCTLLGPISVGVMVKRVKRLQAEERSKQSGREDPLGIWGVIPSAT